MTNTQLAIVRASFLIGVVALIAGVVLFVVDHTTSNQVCPAGLHSGCYDVPQSNRGAWIAGVAALVLVGTVVGWSTLTPKPDASERPSSPRRSGRPLAIAVVVLFVAVAAVAAVDVLTG